MYKKVKTKNTEKGLGKRGDQEADGHCSGAPEILCGDGRKGREGFCQHSGALYIKEVRLLDQTPVFCWHQLHIQCSPLMQ